MPPRLARQKASPKKSERVLPIRAAARRADHYRVYKYQFQLVVFVSARMKCSVKAFLPPLSLSLSPSLYRKQRARQIIQRLRCRLIMLMLNFFVRAKSASRRFRIFGPRFASRNLCDSEAISHGRSGMRVPPDKRYGKRFEMRFMGCVARRTSRAERN